ncbi:serine hydrolase [Agaribacterium haliotis]|uniref:serine hydrolase n=1 Tax=Agaribacterium haliotis TaxID=2013869 RepID=UPI001304371D|nr:serine hydrolase [Agaribacterium haliotis]
MAQASLWQAKDERLQAQLEQVISKLQLGSAVAEDKLAVSFVDITDIDKPRVASVNGEQMYYAASLPKLTILLAAFVEIERKQLTLSDKLWRDMNDMIRHSSNAAATRVLNKVGREQLIDILQEQDFALYDRQHGGGLWLGKAYDKSPAYARDPLNNLSHGASAMQTARFYYLLESGRLVEPELSAKMKEILVKPGINHKFVKGLSQVQGLNLYRKSGTWKHFHADSVLVEAENYRYIAVGLAQSRDGGRWLEQLALPLEQIIATHYSQENKTIN